MLKLVNNDCYKCIHSREVPGNTHIKCVNPDPKMTGASWGRQNGWFIYPRLFDPTWMTRKCANYSPPKAEKPEPPAFERRTGDPGLTKVDRED